LLLSIECISQDSDSRRATGEESTIINSYFLSKGEKMKLSSPKVVTWWVALVLAVLGVLASLVTIPVLSGIAFWLVVIAAALLLVATAVKGL
jgi:threonine/homoserine/homoserine lactone efflux protein